MRKREVGEFFSKLHQLKPDIGVMLSPAGFTSGAMSFAEDEGIVLAEFRPVAATDSWVQKVQVEIHLLVPGDPTITDIEWVDPDEVKPLAGQMLHVDPHSDVRDASGAVLGTFGEMMSEAMRDADAGPMQAGRIEGETRFDEPRIVEINGTPVRPKALKFWFETLEAVETLVVQESGVAEMILRQITGTGAEEGRVFFDKDFRALTFDTDRRVMRRPSE